MFTVLLSTAYLPPVYYFAKLLKADRVLVEQCDHYVKQTFRNRCTIAAPQGPLHLTVPVVHPTSPHTPMRDIRISDHGNWRHLHWNALESAYGQSPFFLYYADDFRPLYEQSIPFLMDFNEQLLRLVCRLLGLAVSIERTTVYLHAADLPQAADISSQGTDASTQAADASEQATDSLLDLRSLVDPRQLQVLSDPQFRAVPYPQVFCDRQGFLPHLSIVDLLFNMGPESLPVLRRCAQLPAYDKSASPATALTPFTSPHPLFVPQNLVTPCSKS